MKYRNLGKSGPEVSTVCLGTMTFGQERWGTDAKTSESILNSFVEAGGNFIDTADTYAGTASEQIVGNWLAGKQREKIILGSKCFFPNTPLNKEAGLSNERIRRACDDSLARLRTDYIDLYQLHAPDPNTPIEETLTTLDSLVKQGKVRHIGFCNMPAWELTKAQHFAKSADMAEFSSGQYLYNLLKRDIETEVLPACNDAGIGILCWSPLSGGMLTGKYPDTDVPPDGTRLAERGELTRDRYAKWVEKSRAVVGKVREIAEQHDVHPAQISLSWLLAQKGVTSLVTGASSDRQINSNCRAADLELDENSLNALTALSQPETPYPQSWIQTIHAEYFPDGR